MKPAIDWSLCIERAGGNTDLARTMLAEFMKALPAAWEEIAALYHAADYPELTDALHRLHGAACYTGVPELKLSLSEFELALHADEQNLTPLFDRCKQAVTAVHDAYDSKPLTP